MIAKNLLTLRPASDLREGMDNNTPSWEELSEMLSPTWLKRAQARYDDPHPLTLTLSHGQMAALGQMVTLHCNALEEKYRDVEEVGHLKLCLGVEYLIEECLGWPYDPEDGWG